MKTANPFLIDFLANAKQFVMWDDITITLANGTVLSYSTRDQDRIKRPAAAPTGTVFSDAFDGAANTPLQSHSPNTAPAGFSYSVTDPSTQIFFLTGDGSIGRSDSIYANGSSVSPSSWSWDVSAGVTVTTQSTLQGASNFGTVSGGISGAIAYFGFAMSSGPGATPSQIEVFYGTAGDDVITIDAGLVPGGVQHTVAVSFTSAGYTIVIDGATVNETTVAIDMSSEALTGLSFGIGTDTSDSVITIDTFEVHIP